MARIRVLPWFQGDGAAVAGSSIGFSFALGASSVALPIQAVVDGFSITEVGIFTAISALAQIVCRLFVGRMMRSTPDRSIVVVSCACLAISCFLIAFTGHVAAFLIAQLLQGAARAGFWTASQTHVVRGEGSSVKALAYINLVANLGTVTGPVVAGAITGVDARPALVVSGVVALVTILPAVLLTRLPPFSKRRKRAVGAILSRPGVFNGVYASMTTGAWRGLLSSYVPLMLLATDHSSFSVGFLIGIANATQVIGTALVMRVRPRWYSAILLIGIPVTGLAVALLGPFAASSIVAGTLLGVSGITAGALMTLGPAIATDAVDPEDRGDSIAVTGTGRAIALFVTPLAAAGLVSLVPLAAAMVISGGVMGIPLFWRTRNDGPVGEML